MERVKETFETEKDKEGYKYRKQYKIYKNDYC